MTTSIMFIAFLAVASLAIWCGERRAERDKADRLWREAWERSHEESERKRNNV